MRWLLPALWLAACAGPDDTDRDWIDETDGPMVSGCVEGPDAYVDVGKGEDDLLASDVDNRHSVLIHGLQGGFHTFVSLRGHHLDLEGPWYMVIEGLLDDEIRAVARLDREPHCNEDVGAGEIIGTWLIWRAFPTELHEQDVTIRAVVVDGDRRVILGQTEQVIWDPELAE